MSTRKASTNGDEGIPSSNEERPKCGIIMPISAIDGLSPVHWDDVKSILCEAINAAGFNAELVSEGEESTIIQKTIIHNLYNNPMVVCDVSGKNPNVMFELGIRLTFDKPTVVVKDDQTNYSFDTSPIEHLTYPRDLRFNQIMQFKEKLSAKVKSTHELAKSNRNYSTFLKHFGQFTVPKLDQQEVPADQFIIKRLEELTQSMNKLERSARFARGVDPSTTHSDELMDSVYKVRVHPEAEDYVRAMVAKILAVHPEIVWNIVEGNLIVHFPRSISSTIRWMVTEQINNIPPQELEKLAH